VISDYLAVAELFVEVTQHNQVGRGSGHHSRTTYIAEIQNLKKILQTSKKRRIQQILSDGGEQSHSHPLFFVQRFALNKPNYKSIYFWVISSYWLTHFPRNLNIRPGEVLGEKTGRYLQQFFVRIA
jgi:hypothetical protein